jgi:hypothetical protein
MKRTDNHGSLGRNKKKEKSTHPDHRGQCVIEGRPFWISAYVNTNQETGEKFFKLYFKPREDELSQPERPAAPPPAAPAPEPLADQPDIPF